MMRVVAWVAVSFAVASAQESKDAEAKPVPVEASAAIRESLLTSHKPKLYDVLPDPVRYPELHAEQAKLSREDGRLAEFAGFPCYRVDSAGGLADDYLQIFLDTLSASSSLQATANDGRFWPETLISWGKGKDVRWMAWSTKMNEVVFIDGEKQMRYGFTAEASRHLSLTVGDMRVMRPDALEEAAPLLNTIREGASITVHEGLPRLPPEGGTEDLLKRRGEWPIGAYQFLKTGTVERDTAALRELLLKKDALATWGGGKACGGFHPDFAITWKVAERDVSLLICLGCHEAKFVGPAGDLLYDLPSESYDALEAELGKFRPGADESPPAK